MRQLNRRLQAEIQQLLLQRLRDISVHGSHAADAAADGGSAGDGSPSVTSWWLADVVKD